MAIVMGLILGSSIAFVRKALSGGIDDPEQVERLLGARVVYATIPHSITQEKLTRRVKGEDTPLPLLAQIMPEDPAVESLRSFRAALQFALPHFKNNVVMLAGATRGLGKSFVVANLAAVIASSGKRVLLLDADFRNGHLHRYFGVSRERGLSKAINGEIGSEDIIHYNVLDNLDFIPTGVLPPNRSEFLLLLNFSALLESLRSDYDLVLINPPSILLASDALIIGRHAGAAFIVARAGVTTDAEIVESIKRLNHVGLSPQGILFNDLTPALGRYAAFHHSEPVAQIGLAG
jgi:tyrosine-protein kinase Etk/Wzc